ncbi:hypothetical protein DFH28DRAFT_902640 [Melampsora americana]|nr:hypothetical protein DFH28DRAFT_902640 [Melampsora americana]
MAKGKKIECPLGGPSNKKQRTQLETQGSAILAKELDANEAKYINNRIKEIECALNDAANNQAIPVEGGDVEIPAANETPNADNENSLYNHVEELLPHQDQEGVPRMDVPFSEYVKGSYYKSKRLAEKKNWQTALPAMFLSYMTLCQETSQWGNTSNWNHDYNIENCACGGGDLKIRKVDMVDILERTQQEIVFCKCTLDQVRLIRMGYIGGSPVHPQVAFSIRLLRLHHAMWKYCTVRTQGFTLGLDEFLDPASPLILVAKTKQASIY